MRALVTGASGFVGSALCRTLAGRGDEVVGLTRDPDGARARVAEGVAVRFVAGGVGNPQEIADAAAGCDVVFHAAGLPPGPAPGRVLRWLHVAGTENVLRAVRHARVRRLVHVSCADVSLTLEDRMHWDEQRALSKAPTGLFAQTKLTAEEIALAASDDTLGVSALRPALLWGAGDIDGLGRLARELQRGEFCLYDGGRNVIATTHIDELVSAALIASEREQAQGRAFYIADGEFMEARELFPRLAGALGLSAALPSKNLALALALGFARKFAGDDGAELTRVLRRGKSALFDMSQASRELDYAPKPSFDERMSALAAWVGAQGGASALIARTRPAPRTEDVDAQVRAAGGD